MIKKEIGAFVQRVNRPYKTPVIRGFTESICKDSKTNKPLRSVDFCMNGRHFYDNQTLETWVECIGASSYGVCVKDGNLHIIYYLDPYG